MLTVSPDGGLQQSSSVADTITFTFAGGEVKRVPASYIEFAERLVLPIYSDLHSNEVIFREVESHMHNCELLL